MKPQPTHNQTDITFWTRDKFVILGLFVTLGSLGLLHMYLVKTKGHGIVAAVGKVIPGALSTPPVRNVRKVLPTINRSNAYWHTISTQKPWPTLQKPATMADCALDPNERIKLTPEQLEVIRDYLDQILLARYFSSWAHCMLGGRRVQV